ncbi:ribosome hibernation-promoting factor, HPF/YfiA family [Paenibacillus aquistagni]|uniref:ribosome hibernation-promoting factor, HPF/YfiA family n=1 Tax=Paenibacillus aquistagni TaxID=1852522 RepID=UPI00145B0857|nr:ribosome-associated translation inhibitor RaiA [Paenibacillus aquistagni]NMM54300.1 ribosome-associated translation inhibitor RaiA [Paenibacillus aquistagni]
MKYSIRGQNIEVTEALRDYVEKKLDRLERYFEAPPTSDVNVTLSVVKEKHRVEVTILLPGLILRAEDGSRDMYASVDAVLDKLERQIRKHKTKVNRKFRYDDARKFFAEEPVPAGGAADEDELEVVRTKRFTFKPMDVEEAILQMDLLGHDFYVFKDADTREVNVVYRRQDGRYGLIEQE